MSKPERREILSRVAAGTISPEEAAAQLDAINADERQAESSIRTVRVVRQLGSFEIIGDPSVRDAVAEGPHHARIEGDVMVFEGGTSDGPGGFMFGLGRNLLRDAVLIRMNPALGLDVQVQAGDCRVRGVEGPIRARVQAGSATIDGFASAVDFTVNAGDLQATGRLDSGDSRIVCKMGNASLHLERGSSVRIKSRSSLGDIELPDRSHQGGGNLTKDFIVGDGAASLAIETTLGSVKVTSDQ
jgi:hypothetical protein